MSTSVKKVLQVKKGQYLLTVKDRAFLTTYHMDEALNISFWDLEMLGFVASTLRGLGYKNVKVITYDEEVN